MKQKQTKKQIILILLILSLIIMTSCNINNRRPGPPIYQGTQGIEINFINNAPPENVRENSFTNIMVDVWNRGAYDIPDNEIIINLRYNNLYFQQDNTDPNFILSRNSEGALSGIAGKSEIWTLGERRMLPLTRLNVLEIPGTIEMPQTTMELVACYSYKTFLSEMICLDTDIYGVDTNPICRNKEKYTYSSQGAPIAITKLEVDILPMGFRDLPPVAGAHQPIVDEEGNLQGIGQATQNDQLILVEPVIRIYARNAGRGDVFIATQPNIETINLCSFRDYSFEYRDHNKIKLTNATLDGFEMDCEKTTLNLANPSDFITCRLHYDLTGYLKQNVEAPLNIEFEYYYKEEITKRIRIQR